MWVMDLCSHSAFSCLFCHTSFSQLKSLTRLRKPPNLFLNLHIHFQLCFHLAGTFSSFKIFNCSKFCQNHLFILLAVWGFNIMEELRRLDLLINLQVESFKEMLEEPVSFHSPYLTIFFHGFPFAPFGLHPF